jgi:hypothetical protein
MVILPQTGHEKTTTTTIEATCTEPGTITVTCDKCRETISTETIPAKGHSYGDDSLCDHCGAKDPDAVSTFVPVVGTESTDAAPEIGEDGTLTYTFKAGTNSNAPMVTITGPANGWKQGEQNQFSVTSTDNMACVVMMKDADGKLTKLTHVAEESGVFKYELPQAFDSACKILVVVKGDANGDGIINNKDIVLVKRLANKTTWTDYELCVMNVIGNDSTIGNKEIVLIKRAANKRALAW